MYYTTYLRTFQSFQRNLTNKKGKPPQQQLPLMFLSCQTAKNILFPADRLNNKQQHDRPQHRDQERIQIKAGHAGFVDNAHQKPADHRADDSDGDVGEQPHLLVGFHDKAGDPSG